MTLISATAGTFAGLSYLLSQALSEFFAFDLELKDGKWKAQFYCILTDSLLNNYSGVLRVFVPLFLTAGCLLWQLWKVRMVCFEGGKGGDSISSDGNPNGEEAASGSAANEGSMNSPEGNHDNASATLLTHVTPETEAGEKGLRKRKGGGAASAEERNNQNHDTATELADSDSYDNNSPTWKIEIFLLHATTMLLLGTIGVACFYMGVSTSLDACGKALVGLEMKNAARSTTLSTDTNSSSTDPLDEDVIIDVTQSADLYRDKLEGPADSPTSDDHLRRLAQHQQQQDKSREGSQFGLVLKNLVEYFVPAKIFPQLLEVAERNVEGHIGTTSTSQKLEQARIMPSLLRDYEIIPDFVGDNPDLMFRMTRTLRWAHAVMLPVLGITAAMQWRILQVAVGKGVRV